MPAQTPAPTDIVAPTDPQRRVWRKPIRLTQRAEFLRAAAAGKKAAIGGVVLQALARGDRGPGCDWASPSPRRSATPWCATGRGGG